MPAPKVSVIIPLYNGEKFIGGAIDSVLNQTYRDFELIMVDDGSTDQTKETVLRVKQPLTYIYQANCGVAVARNHGFLHARGEFIAFLDQDDVWYPNKLATQVAILQKYINVGVVYSDVDAIDESGAVTDGGSLGGKPKLPFLRFFPEFPHPHPFPSTVLMRRVVFSGAGMFDPAFRRNGHEDTELWFRIAKNRLGEFRFYPEPLAQRRQHASQGGRDRDRMDDNWIVCLTKLTALYQSEVRQLRQLKRMLARTYFHRAERLTANGDWLGGKINLQQSLRYNPWALKALISYARALLKTS